MENGKELEIPEHSHVNFYPEKCPFCYTSDIKRRAYKIRTIRILGCVAFIAELDTKEYILNAKTVKKGLV